MNGLCMDRGSYKNLKGRFILVRASFLDSWRKAAIGEIFRPKGTGSMLFFKPDASEPGMEPL
jgi:hypothetical protein